MPPSGPDGEGFGWDPGSLRKIHNSLLDGAEDLDGAVTKKPPAVDAGASSDVVAKAMVRLQKIGTVIAQHVDTTGRKVDSAHGSYADIENTNAGQLKVDSRYPELATDHRRPGPHGPSPKYDGPLLNSARSDSGHSGSDSGDSDSDSDGGIDRRSHGGRRDSLGSSGSDSGDSGSGMDRRPHGGRRGNG